MFHSVRSPLLPAMLFLLTLLIFLIDALTALDIAIAVLYVVVVLLAAAVWQRAGVLATAVLCLLLTPAAYALSHPFVLGPASGRLVVSMAAIGITAFLALRGQAATRDLLQREEALRRSEAFLAGTQRISQTGSFSFKAPGGEIYWSEESARIYGVDSRLMPNTELVLQRTMPEDRALVRQAMDQALRGEGAIDFRHRLLMPDGAVKYVHVLAHPTPRREGHDGGHEYLGALMDVTAATQAEQALHRSQLQLAHATRVTTLGELAASIAHEVNQPLAAISANGEACLRWMDRPEPDMGEARAAVARMLDATGRATEVIRRIRALARKSDPQHVLLDLSAVAEETAVLVRPELASNNVTLALELAADLPPVCGDRVQLQQVIINLLINGMQAISAARQPGQARRQGQEGDDRLLLKTSRRDDGGALLSVNDSGPGIPPDQVPHLFEAFYTTKPDGMGMGLPICRSIIEAHGGRIWALARDTSGATLQFSLPAEGA
ncbi:MAG TPA: ATP-binding protein [Janthinobacterium sp.]|jgi:PAS domain S-box-containing protein|nr:ATP-binding protein [Janthinobacterium sp.]